MNKMPVGLELVTTKLRGIHFKNYTFKLFLWKFRKLTMCYGRVWAKLGNRF
jgi:hypothetical protein